MQTVKNYDLLTFTLKVKHVKEVNDIATSTT